MADSAGTPLFSSWTQYLQGDSLYGNAIRLQILVRTIQRHATKGCRVLEAGFGSGSTGVLLADLGYKVTLLDVEAGLFDLFVTRFPGFAAAGKLELIHADMYDMPFGNSSFDVIYHQGVLEHLQDKEIVLALQEQARVGRTVIIDVPNGRYRDRPFGDERHIPVQVWRQLIHQAGLEIIEVSGRRYCRWTYALPHGLFLPTVSDRLKLGRWAGTVSIFICRPVGVGIRC